MSYCRWSSDDFQCDVYVYQAEDGWWTWVAGGRPDYKQPLPPPIQLDPDDPEFIAAWCARHEVVCEMYRLAGRKDIGLPYDGQSFHDATPGDCADRLDAMKALGYNVPQEAIDQLREEAAEHANVK